MAQVFTFNRDRKFTLQEAQELLPLVLKITRIYRNKVKQLVDKIENLNELSYKKNWQLEEEINFLINQWKSKLQKLGVQPRGLWIGDFPMETGYYCWKFPESKIAYWHSHEDGFTKRKSLTSMAKNSL